MKSNKTFKDRLLDAFEKVENYAAEPTLHVYQTTVFQEPKASAKLHLSSTWADVYKTTWGYEISIVRNPNAVDGKAIPRDFKRSEVRDELSKTQAIEFLKSFEREHRNNSRYVETDLHESILPYYAFMSRLGINLAKEKIKKRFSGGAEPSL